jgi:hypothetical protein
VRFFFWSFLPVFPDGLSSLAVDDANNVVLKRPTWSKGYARCGEAYARQHNWVDSEHACSPSSPLACRLFIELTLHCLCRQTSHLSR